MDGQSRAAGVVVVGSANADLVVRVGRHPGPGETVLGSDLVIHPGGKGANQAVAAARLGARVAMVGRVGADAHGELLVGALERDGVDTSALLRGGTPTGVALITVGEDGENTIVVAPGANARVTGTEAADAVRRFGWARVVSAQLEIPPEAVAAAARAAQQRGARFVLNASPPDLLADRGFAAEVLPLCDPLVVNEHEARFLAGDGDDHGSGLLRLGVRSAVVTLGERGAVVLTKGGGRTEVPGVPVEVVDTTGAGDAFTGALAWRLGLGTSGSGVGSGFESGVGRGAEAALVDAVRWAVRAGAAAVRAYGAQSACPRVEELPGP